MVVNLLLRYSPPTESTRVSIISLYHSLNIICLVRKPKYFKIDDNIRRTILFKVLVMNVPLKTVCDNLNVNFSSAKNVTLIFKNEGRIEKKLMRVRKNKKIAESNIDLDLSLA